MTKSIKGSPVKKSSKQNKLSILKQSNKKLTVHIKKKSDLRFRLRNKSKIKSIHSDLILQWGKFVLLCSWAPKI